MTQGSSPLLRIWGRANSVNVQKVLWCCHELDIPFERIDAGMQFGINTEPDYLAMNPNGRVPSIQHGDFSLWESNAILRYLALTFGEASDIYPRDIKARAGMERWLDWSLSTLQPAERPMFWGLVRTPVAERDMNAMQQAADANAKLWTMVNNHLAGRVFLEGTSFTLADITIGAYARRWFGVEGIVRPELAELERWYGTISKRPGFQTYVAKPLT